VAFIVLIQRYCPAKPAPISQGKEAFAYAKDTVIFMRSNTFKILTLVFCLLIISAFLVSCGDNVDRNSEFKMVKGVDALNENGSEEYMLLSFEGIGISPFVIKRGSFSWLPILLGAIIALAYAFFKSKQEKLKLNDFIAVLSFGIVGGVIGSRIFYILTSHESFKGRFFDIFKIWEGGSIYGAIIGASLTVLVVCKLLKINLLKSFDLCAASFMLGQIIGRWSDFLNGSSYGYEIKSESSLYWIRMGIYPHVNSAITVSDTHIAYVHPTFLYESLWNLLGFILISIFYSKKKKFDGQIFLMYITWYGLGRTFIELFRTDSIYMFGTISASLILACISFFAGVALLAYGFFVGKKKRLANEDYESAYPLIGTKFARKNSNNPKKEEDKNNETD